MARRASDFEDLKLSKHTVGYSLDVLHEVEEARHPRHDPFLADQGSAADHSGVGGAATVVHNPHVPGGLPPFGVEPLTRTRGSLITV